MNYSNFNISLDVHQPGSQVWLTAKQGETARKIYISLTESGAPYEIAEGATPVFAAKKADGNIIFNNCSFEGSQIVYEVTAQTTAALGKLECSIKLYGADSKLLISPRFVINIVPDVYTDSEFIESVTEVNTLTSLITEAVDLIAAAEDGLFVPKISIGTVETLSAGSNATASITGDFRAPVLNLGIPQGPQGQAESLIPDTALSLESTKPVQNKVIAKAINDVLEAINDVLEAIEKKADSEALSGKVDKVSGKGLSANDFTNEYKTKLDGIEAEANKYVLADSAVTPEKLDRPYLSLGERPAIASGDDLDTYLTPGTYASRGASISTTLLNCPTGNSFNLDVSNARGQTTTGTPSSATYRYFNQKLTDAVTGDIWVRALFFNNSTTLSKTDWVRLLTTADLYPLVTIETSHNLSSADVGKTLLDRYANRSSAHTISLTQAASENLPTGAEISIINKYATAMTINFTGVRAYIDGEETAVSTSSKAGSVKLASRKCTVVLKKLEKDTSSGDMWIITGKVEAVS